jgi:2-haloacid dehalogenase
MYLKHIFFDVNETLTDFSQITDAMQELGLSNSDMQLWFSRVLRDGFAITLTNQPVNFAQVAEVALANLLQERNLSVTPDQITQTIKQIAQLPAQKGVAEAFAQVKDLNLTISTLTNGSTAAAEFIFNQLDINHLVSNILSVQNNAKWKPHLEAYQYALSKTGASAKESALVAVHPWDIHGANQAGLSTVWINRKQLTYPSYFSPPTASITELSGLAKTLSEINPN